eukprot:1139731-Pelagomonas_calceolata.AAC.1
MGTVRIRGCRLILHKYEHVMTELRGVEVGTPWRPAWQLHGVKVDADNPRRRPGQRAATEVAYWGQARPPCF